MKNKELIMQKAYKGNTVVLISSTDDIFKIKLILKDTSKFDKIEIDESKVINYLINMENSTGLHKILKEKNEISRETYNTLYLVDARYYTFDG